MNSKFKHFIRIKGECKNVKEVRLHGLVANCIHKPMTDQEVYNKLKGSRNKNLMNADEWKRQRLAVLNQEGHTWSGRKGAKHE